MAFAAAASATATAATSIATATATDVGFVQFNWHFWPAVTFLPLPLLLHKRSQNNLLNTHASKTIGGTVTAYLPLVFLSKANLIFIDLICLLSELSWAWACASAHVAEIYD